ncbi:MAG: hypothetical protein ACT4NY_10265 [Pseudonocardiales bacterium]
MSSYEQVRAAKEEHEATSREAVLAQAYAEAQARAQELRATASSSPSQNGNGLVVPTGQEVLSRLVYAVGAELAGSLAGPLLFLALLSTPTAQAVPIQWREQLKEQLRTFLHEWANTVERREHLRLLGQLATAIAVSPLLNLDSDEQERVSKVVAQPSRVDAQSIEHIETILSDCKRQEDRFGPYSVLHTVIAQREFVDSLLDECSDELRSRLLSLYSSMSSSIGTYFFNLEDPASAMHYLDEARAAAQEARNTELSIYALCEMSYFSSWQGKAHAAIDFAAAAQSMASKADDALLQVFAADRVGIAYAIEWVEVELDRRAEAARSEIDEAAKKLESREFVKWYQDHLMSIDTALDEATVTLEQVRGEMIGGSGPALR